MNDLIRAGVQFFGGLIDDILGGIVVAVVILFVIAQFIWPILLVFVLIRFLSQ
jgi:hypothetical protein